MVALLTLRLSWTRKEARVVDGSAKVISLSCSLKEVQTQAILILQQSTADIATLIKLPNLLN